jgi:hypothetical protein
MRSAFLTTHLAQVLIVALTGGAVVAAPTRETSHFKVLHNFGAGNDGAVPSGPLSLDGRGDLYGSTYDGGTGKCSDYGCGMTFELQPQAGGGWKEIALHEFTGGSDGSTPVGNLVLDANGDAYGTTNAAGGGQASVFELRRGSKWKLSPLYGPYFSPGLTSSNVGDLYGFFGQGKFGDGAIGELSPGTKGWMYTQFYSFCNEYTCPDGDGPEFPLCWDAHGNLYGTTAFGGNGPPECPGSLGCGVAFQMTPNSDGTWTYHVMHRFANFPTDGQYPDGGLVVDATGAAYGVTGYGGVHGQGTVFKMTPSTGGHWKQSVLYDFPNCGDGCFPGRTLVFDQKGNLYGVSSGGIADCGGYTCGVVFKLTPQKNGPWTYSVVHKFDGKNGASPWGVIVDDKGNIFGTTENGGTYNAGVAFEITP